MVCTKRICQNWDVNFDSMADFALIGATGRVGRLITRAWRNTPGPWTDTPIQTRDLSTPASATHIPWDIAQGSAALQSWMKVYGNLSCLIVLAGTTPATGTDMDHNVILAKSYVQAAHDLGIPRVLIASSSAVYGSGSGSPLAETDPCSPLNAYGASKQKMEQALRIHPLADGGLCCLRIGNVLGADALFLNAAQGGSITLDVFDNGHGPLRSYIGPSDLAHVLGHLATTTKNLPFTLNIAAPTPVHMDSLAKAANLDWAARPAPETALQNLTLDCRKLMQFVALSNTASDPTSLIKDWKRNRSP